MTLFRFNSLVVCCIIADALVGNTSLAQSPAEQQAAVQQYMKIVPKVGPSVARIDITGVGGRSTVGGFVVGESNWVVTLGKFIDDAGDLKVSFKQSQPFGVAEIKFRDPATGLVVLELASDAEREPLSIASRSAKSKELQLFLDIPQPAVVGMTFGTRVKSEAARMIREVADTKMAGNTLLTIFNVPGTQKGIGTPIFNPRGEVVGMIVGIGEQRPDEVYSLAPDDLTQALKRMTDPDAANKTKLSKSSDASVNGKPAAHPSGGEFREWKSGKFSTKAKYVAQRDGKVQLQQPSGKTIVVSIDQLSAADQDFLKAKK